MKQALSVFVRYKGITTFKQAFSPFYSVSILSFSKKHNQAGNNHKIVDQKQDKVKKEKEVLNKIYENVSKEDLVLQYVEKTKAYIQKESDNLSKVMSLKINTKLFEDVPVLLKHDKSKISEIATISMKGANIFHISPYDPEHKESIIKALQTTKLDLQISQENAVISIIVGPIPKDVKNEIANKLKRIEINFKEEIKKLRHEAMSEAKRLEKIVGKDEARKMEKNLSDAIEKETKKMEKDIKQRVDEVAK